MTKRLLFSIFLLGTLRFGLAFDGANKEREEKARQITLSHVAKKFIFDKRPMEEIENDLSYKKLNFLAT